MNQKILHENAYFFWSNKHCGSQPAGSHICLLVLIGEVENGLVLIPGLCPRVFSIRERKGFAWRLWDVATSLWCWSEGSRDPGQEFKVGTKVF